MHRWFVSLDGSLVLQVGFIHLIDQRNDSMITLTLKLLVFLLSQLPPIRVELVFLPQFGQQLQPSLLLLS